MKIIHHRLIQYPLLAYFLAFGVVNLLYTKDKAYYIVAIIDIVLSGLPLLINLLFNDLVLKKFYAKHYESLADSFIAIAYVFILFLCLNALMAASMAIKLIVNHKVYTYTLWSLFHLGLYAIGLLMLCIWGICDITHEICMDCECDEDSCPLFYPSTRV